MTLLAAVTLTAVVLLVGATAALFLPGTHTPGSNFRRLIASVLTVAVALTVGGVLGVPEVARYLVAAGFAAVVVASSLRHSDWAVRGALAWAMALVAGLGYLSYVASWTVRADLPWLGLLAGTLLWVLEVFVFVLGITYGYELVDVLARRRWRRRVDLDSVDPAHRPFVSLHVPAYNEPPDMVIETLQALLRLEYDNYEVIMVDDNTSDPSLWLPVQEFCSHHDRLRFVHLEDWPGYKSGALNYALSITDPRAEVVGVVDADYLVQPDFLARCAPLFADPDLSFVQTPQDYRGWEQAPYFRRLYHSYGYFFDVSQRSRNEVDGAIFGGTMGLIRAEHLRAVGGWDEWCITEDAELSLRLLKAGGSGLHVEQSFGHGVMPLTFEALKRQRFRWCFGGVQILRMHWRDLLPWARSDSNRLTVPQRWAYLVGGLQWFADLAGVLFGAFVVVGALDLVLGQGLVIRRLSGLLLLCLLVLVVLGAVRSLALLRRVRGVGSRDAVGAFGIWLALNWTVALGAVRGAVAKEGAFLRTPKVRGELGWRDALRGNRVEGVLAVVALGVAAVTLAHATWAATMLGALLVWQGLGHGLAPLNSLAAIRADLSPELRRRRRERLRAVAAGTPARRAAWSGAVLAAAGIALVALAAPTTTPTIPDIDPPPGQDEPSTVVGPDTPAPSRSPRPAGTRPASVAEVAATTTMGPDSTPGRREAAPTAAGTAQARPSAARPTARATAGQAARPADGPTAAPRPAQAPEATRAPPRSTPAPAAPTEPARSSAPRPSSRPTSTPTGRAVTG
jgi:cellulose synthase/poly-beta-1,6-N-acetylglucosamine synthase-like glycosyltransferase